MRPISRQFDGSMHAERTRFGDFHEAQIEFLASPGEAETKICQRDISSPQGRWGMGTRGWTADRSQWARFGARLSRDENTRRSNSTSSRGPTRRTIRGERAGTTNAFRPRSPRAGSNGLRMRHSASVRSPRPQCRPL